MQPFIPPVVTSYDPVLALGWGFLVAAIPLALFFTFLAVRRRAAAVVSLTAAAIAFALGSSIIAPIDSDRETTAIRSAAVNEWLEKNYSQYGGAALAPFVGTGESFSAVADDGKYRTMHFAFDEAQGYRLVAVTGRLDEYVEVVRDKDRGDLAAARERKAAQE